MKETRLQHYSHEAFSRCRQEINKENRLAIRLLAFSGLAVSLVNFIVQSILNGFNVPLLKSAMLVFYFAIILFVEKRVLPKQFPHNTALLYILQIPIMLISVLLGSVWDPQRQAVTILLFLLALPAFILDHPLRVMLVQAGWSLFFLGMSAACKEPSLFHQDAAHIFEFYLASCAITNVVLQVRIESLRRLEDAQFILNHDRETGCLSRHALASRAVLYSGKALTVLFGDMDNLSFYHDFYGHDASDAMNRFFAETLMEFFGPEDTYRYGSDEILCISTDTSEVEIVNRITQCRLRLQDFTYEGRSIPLTCAFGYVTGTPSDAVEFKKMVQLADIYAHKVKESGKDQTISSPFDQEHLRRGIAESNFSIHAHAYEINHLTGLPGMSYFVARADELLETVADISRNPVIGYFKLLDMRTFNNEFGYAQGDQLIALTARLLRQHFSNRHICYITSGQFGILCYKEEVEPAIREVAKALASYRPGFPVRGSAGFALYTGEEKAISLLDKAKLAQKKSRRNSGPVLCFYDASLDEELRFQQYILSHVDEAIERGYLKVYYQPIARSITGEVCNEEALSRWDDPVYGFLTPFRFIPMLEEHSLMYKVNLAVVRQVLKDMDTRKELGVPIVPVSVNLSRKDFEQCDMVQEITGLVDRSGYPRSLIKIEITESAFISDPDLLKREVDRFRCLGFEVWLDDFGSEYSTLNLLQELDFDLIKLDMQFMKNFTTGGKNFIIVSEIIDMAKRMGITTLVEGIETTEQFHSMQALGCEKLQGFLFNKPNPLDYIIQRAMSGNGLRFERAETASYYDAVGRINLSEPEPISTHGAEMETAFSAEPPTGILELRDGAMFCLRATDRFRQRLLDWTSSGLLVQADAPVAIEHCPGSLLHAARHCTVTDAWKVFHDSAPSGSVYSVYLRRLASCEYNDSTAFLAVLIHMSDSLFSPK